MLWVYELSVNHCNKALEIVLMKSVSFVIWTDFAVGAPYDGVTGRGAVYIFQGSSTGVRKEFTQVRTTN
jgi:hypothetical protein